MASDGYGVSFAPTTEQSLAAGRQGGIEGVPEAIRVLSLRMPRVWGARSIAPQQLLNAGGAHGQDPVTAVVATLAQALAGGGQSVPSTSIAPPAGAQGGGMGGPELTGAGGGFAPPQMDPGPMLPGPSSYKPPRIVPFEPGADGPPESGLGAPGALVPNAPLGTAGTATPGGLGFGSLTPDAPIGAGFYRRPTRF
jgi:hypothetical protein